MIIRSDWDKKFIIFYHSFWGFWKRLYIHYEFIALMYINFCVVYIFNFDMHCWIWRILRWTSKDLKTTSFKLFLWRIVLKIFQTHCLTFNLSYQISIYTMFNTFRWSITRTKWVKLASNWIKWWWTFISCRNSTFGILWFWVTAVTLILKINAIWNTEMVGLLRCACIAIS